MSSIKLQHTLQTKLNYDNKEFDLTPLLLLLKGLDHTGNLRAAAADCQFSYRKAWNLLDQFEKIFDQTLVEKQRGKGSKLSELGIALLNTEKQNKATVTEQLKTADISANNIIHPLLSASQPLKIIASDSEKLNILRQQQTKINLEIEGSRQALEAYAEKKCDIAGFHIAAENNNEKQMTGYRQYLDPDNDHFFLLEHRQQGFISHPENPVSSFQQIINQQLTFVNRQQGSGTRLLLEAILTEQNIKKDLLNGYFHEEHTHLAVASMIISRQADAGFGIKNVATRLNLHFSPISHELYFLVFKSITPKVKQILEKLNNQKPIEIMDYKTFIDTISLTP